MAIMSIHISDDLNKVMNCYVIRNLGIKVHIITYSIDNCLCFSEFCGVGCECGLC